MRLVLKIGFCANNGEAFHRQLVSAVTHLAHDGHSVVVVCGDACSRQEQMLQRSWTMGERLSGSDQMESNLAAAPLLRVASRRLVEHLRRIGVPGFALCCNDADICRLRKISGNGPLCEVSRVSPRWLEVICSNGGVPIISNLVAGEQGEFCAADADQLAAVCAICWNADALIYIVEGEGITDDVGSVIRWLDIEDIESLAPASGSTAGSPALLKYCRQALKHGVRRVRILPVCSVDSLPLFYFSKIDQGTEVVILPQRQHV